MLHVNLTEPVIFLRRSGDTTASGRRRQPTVDPPPAVLRGIVTLKLSKPTKIKTVSVNFSGIVKTEWPEGIGPQKSEVVEESVLLEANATLFRADFESFESVQRRTKSLGPGISLASHSSDDEESDNELEIRGRRRDTNVASRHVVPLLPSETEQTRGRGVSVDHLGRARFLPRTARTSPPSYNNVSPLYTPEQSMTDLPETEAESSNRVEELRDILRASRDLSMTTVVPPTNASTSAAPSTASSRPSSSRSYPYASRTISELQTGVSNLQTLGTAADIISSSVAVENESPTPVTSPMPRSRRLSFSRNYSANNSTASLRRRSATPGFSEHTPPLTPLHPTIDENVQMGKTPERPSHKRFSFGAAWQEMKERVTKSTRRPSFGVDTSSPQLHRIVTKEESRSREASISRTRDASRGRDKVVRKLGGVLGLEVDEKEKEDWIELRKGTYNWPISFTIPATCPPSLRCDYGSIVYKVQAQVERVGKLTPNLTASTEVTLIACPGEDDTEDTESIVVEREWENQLRYLITLSGKSFPIGGLMPIHMTLMPMAKMSIHRLSAVIEEKVDYFAHSKKVARHDPVRQLELINIRPINIHTPLLPILSDSPDAARASPLAPYVEGDDPSEVARQLLTPAGPWTLHLMLSVPDCTKKIHFTNKNSKAKIVVSHVLKIVMRVERGDDSAVDARGKRRQFDIIIESPIQILSCRCKPDWISLPTYSLFPADTRRQTFGCVCHPEDLSSSARQSRSRDPERRSQSYTTHPPIAVGLYLNDLQSTHGGHRTPSVSREALVDQTTRFARLVAGEELMSGEIPPSYEDATQGDGR
ncbi:hypothetical protein FRC03_008933 [Tulasnella sp. 419]|nr:hypothetical protein FRC02_005763 [Tulasnella sp. 418]KAG8958658.1 hypothetical protein FRC03_008933 [Tulasnella sp. 419]